MHGPVDKPSAGHMLASRTDREQTIDVLKVAFAQERLTEDELDARVGRALAARTYADLDALIADIPSQPRLPARNAPAPRVVLNRSAVRAAKAGLAGVVLVTFPASVAAGAVSGPLAAVAVLVAAMFLVAVAAGSAAAILGIVMTLDSLLHKARKGPGSTPPPPPSCPPHARAQTHRRTSAPAPRRGNDTALAAG